MKISGTPIIKLPFKLTSRLILWLGIIFSFLISLLIELYLINQIESYNLRKLIKVQDDLTLFFDQYLHPMQGNASVLYALNFKMNALTFRKVAASRKFFTNFPGALGFGFIRRVPVSEISSYLKNQWVERPEFQLKRSLLKDNKERGEQEDLAVIELIEPIELNQAALGLVISDEKKRKEAALQAMRTGQATLTSSIKLVQSHHHGGLGFLFFLPIYSSTQIPSTPKERLEKHIGWSFTPLLAKNMMEFILRQNPYAPPLKIYEIKDNNHQQLNLIYSHQQKKKYFFNFFHQTSTRYFEIFGRKWMIQGDLSTANRSSLEIIWPFIIFILCLIISFILYFQFRSFEQEGLRKNEIIQEAQKELAQTYAELQKKNKFLQKVIDGVPEMIGYWDHQLINQLSNYAYNDYFGKDPKDVLGKKISELLPPQVYQGNLPYILKALEGNYQEFERELIDVQGQKRYVLAKYLPDLDSHQQKVLGFFVIVIDITKLRALEQENQEKQAQLYAHAKLSLVGEMAGGIAHEINNPLAIIGGKAQVIEKQVQKLKGLGGAEEKISAILTNTQLITETVERIAKIIRGLRSFSRDTEKDAFTHVSVKKIIQDSIFLVSEKMKNKNIALIYDETHYEDGLILANDVQISQILMNLMINAMDALEGMPLPEKWIEIMLEKVQGDIYISVLDAGPGIPDNVAEKMMQPFFTTKEVGKGTGLGLSISQGIAKNHQGKLTYQLSKGHTQFTLKLPLVIV